MFSRGAYVLRENTGPTGGELTARSAARLIRELRLKIWDGLNADDGPRVHPE